MPVEKYRLPGSLGTELCLTRGRPASVSAPCRASAGRKPHCGRRPSSKHFPTCRAKGLLWLSIDPTLPLGADSYVLPFLCDGLPDACQSSSLTSSRPIAFNQASEHDLWTSPSLACSHVEASNSCHTECPELLQMWHTVSASWDAGDVNLSTQPKITFEIGQKPSPTGLFLFLG